MCDSRDELEHQILQYLDQHGCIEDSLIWTNTQLPVAPNSDPTDRNVYLEHSLVEGALRSLSVIKYVVLESKSNQRWSLTSEAETYVLAGSPEGQVYATIPMDGTMTQAQLESKLGKTILQIGLAQCMSRRLIEFVGDKKAGILKRKEPNAIDTTQQQLRTVADGKIDSIDKTSIDLLKKRKLITLSTYTTYRVTKGEKFSLQRKEIATDLTLDMLKTGKWTETEFKPYNYQALGEPMHTGSLHPLMKVRHQVRSILLEMGFTEMPTNNYVESSFWNFDALFQPQQHPARDSHDTFFLTHPAATRELPETYVQKVKEVHEHGGYGSLGYGYDWKREEANKNVLRTHTTAVSSRMLYALAQQKQFEPKKYFSIDRVFRNETLDATHLAEFHQVEGLIADRNLTLGDLIGTIKTFFQRIGIEEVEFKPAYNPYTEPSMEIFGYSKELQKSIEIGNSGIFRPEMLLPMGLPQDVKVIAWGLSLERPTMIKYGFKNIRDLFGPKVKLDLIQQNPICRFD